MGNMLNLGRIGCEMHNYASRMECYKCNTPRDFGKKNYFDHLKHFDIQINFILGEFTTVKKFTAISCFKNKKLIFLSSYNTFISLR